MKPNRQFVFSAALMVLLAASYTTTQAKNFVTTKAYMFGFAASFNDSTVYFTNIQEVDSVWFTQKKEVLVGRSDYSAQLRSYCADNLNQPRRTCVVMGNMKLKKVEKKYEKMKKMYLKNKKATYDVRFINEEEFKFKPVYVGEGEDDIVVKKEKKKDKPKKDDKRPPRDGKMPPPPPNK